MTDGGLGESSSFLPQASGFLSSSANSLESSFAFDETLYTSNDYGLDDSGYIDSGPDLEAGIPHENPLEPYGEKQNLEALTARVSEIVEARLRDGFRGNIRFITTL